jgi:DNA-binding MarR family transcriptional regulator/N-acetylglutamate synthase-like GNAT family acetyltransferase
MGLDEVRQVRSFNRTVSQRIGALNDRFLKRKRSLGEARLLYEIGSDGADVRELRTRLDLDSGYVSRLLRSLESDCLIKTHRTPDDGRVVRVILTPKGLREVAELDRRSNEFAESVLAALSPMQRERLIAAMAEVERLMWASAIRIDVEPPDGPGAQFCLREYFRELGERFDAGFDATTSISANPEELTPPAGVFVVARLSGRAIGCGALKVKKQKVGEIKRMWVSPQVRGLGVGRRLLEALEARARAFRLKTLRLETNRNLTEAQQLYRSAGYVEVDAFNDEPYAHHWFEKTDLTKRPLE